MPTTPSQRVGPYKVHTVVEVNVTITDRERQHMVMDTKVDLICSVEKKENNWKPQTIQHTKEANEDVYPQADDDDETRQNTPSHPC